jgi:hypothetical protein
MSILTAQVQPLPIVIGLACGIHDPLTTSVATIVATDKGIAPYMVPDLCITKFLSPNITLVAIIVAMAKVINTFDPKVYDETQL